MVKVIDEYYGYLMSYIKDGDNSLDNSLHLAYSSDGSKFDALNSNRGICFAKNTSTNKNDNENGFKSPVIFRKNDGTYGLIATNNDNYSYVYILESNDLINFKNETKLTLNSSGKKVLYPKCYYDSVRDEYVINWTDGAKTYRNTTKDFINVSEAIEADYEAITNDITLMPSNAVKGSILPLTQSEYKRVVNKLGVVTNIDIEKVTLEIAAGETAELPSQVIGHYSDGSTASLNVSWNEEELENIDFNKAGIYEIGGTVSRKEYANPFIKEKADPWIRKGSDGYYYFTATYPMYGSDDNNGYSKITLRRAETIEALQSAKEVTIWDSKNSVGIHRYIWAPEIHEINGKWYVYFTGSISSSVWGIRPHVLECTGDNIMDSDSWVERGLVKTVDGDSFSFNDFSLDMTYFENKGIHYVIWAQKGAASDLYMATINQYEPWKLTSRPMLLTTPEYSWERINENVNEGPAVIKRDAKVFICFSAAATGVEYCMGILTADVNSDLMDTNSWTKTPYPILTSEDVSGEYGPGHNSFTVDENGNDVFVYHARSQECYENKCSYSNQDPLYDPCRHARVKNVHWAVDGTPILKMTDKQSVSIENKVIKATIKIYSYYGK